MLKYRIYFASIIIAYFGCIVMFWLYGDPRAFELFEWAQGVIPVRGPWLHQPYAHAPLPFVDLAGIFSWRECYLRGVDLALSNPCDVISRGPANYSPIIWHLPIEWMGSKNPIPAAIALGSCFLAVALCLFRPKNCRDLLIAVFATMSPPVFFALERANLDLLIFVLTVGAALLPQRKTWSRLIFYICTIMSAFLKLYPFVLLVTLVREPARRFLVLLCLSLTVIGIFLSGYWTFFAHLALPKEEAVGMFGGKILAKEIQQNFGLTDAGRTVFYTFSCLISVTISLLIAARMKGNPEFQNKLDRASSLLLCGGLLILGCFFSGLSVYYRAIFLLPVLAGLLTMRRSSNSPDMKKLIPVTIFITMMCLYGDSLRIAEMKIIHSGLIETVRIHSAAFVSAMVVVKELFWWSEITILTGIILALLVPFLSAARTANHNWKLPAR